MPITHGLPEDPDLTFTMVSPSAPPPTSPDLPALQTWTVVTNADDTQTLVDGTAVASGSDNPDHAAAYRLLRQIGQGAMGEVWEAEQTSLGRTIAVKRLRRQDGQQVSENLLREADFRSESVIAASLEHPNILPVYDFGRDADGDLLLAMKRVHGTPWKDQLRAEFADTSVDSFLARHIPILMAVTQAVAFAHSRGIIHRDLKPAQVLVGAFGEVLLTDWGLAIQIADRQGSMRTPPQAFAPTPATATNPAGTPSLMAPEQTETHGGNLGPWTDVYLLGGTLYYLLTGHYPHASESSEAAFAHARNGRVQPPSARAPERLIPAELEQLCLKALEPDKADRLPTAEAFLKGLEDYQRGTARKEKSAELVAQVEQRFDAGEPDYASYTAAIATLDEARRLWPDNPSLPALRQRTLHDSARLALREGDLSFAHLQSEAMVDDDDARSLRHAIDVRRRQVGRRRSLLRFTAAAVFVLLVVIAGGSLVFSRRMQAANKAIAQHAKQTEQALKIAKTRSAGAFDLINFVLNDLKKAMDQELTPAHGVTTANRNLIASAIAGKVANPIVTYFDSAKPTSWPKDMQIERTKRMGDVAFRFMIMERYEEAEKMLNSAIALREKLPNPDADLDELRTNLALTYNAQSHFKESLPIFMNILRQTEARTGPDSEEMGDTLINLGTTYWHLGNSSKDASQLAKAESYMRRAVALFKKHPEYPVDRLPHSIGVLSLVISDEGHLEEAEKLQRQALDIAQRTMPSDSAIFNNLFENLGVTLAQEKKYDEAGKFFRKTLAHVEATNGPNTARAAATERNIGTLLVLQHRYKEAEPWLQRTLKTYQKVIPDDPQTAKVLRQLGRQQIHFGDYSKAESLFDKSIAIYTAALGPDHFEVGNTKLFMGMAQQRAHQLHQAQATLQSAVDILQKTVGPEDSHTVKAQKILGEVNASLKK